MKKYITAFTMTQSMFCAIPFSCKDWDENARPYMLLFLPAVGLEIGLCWIIANELLYYLHIPHMIYGLVMCAVPYLLSGCIHLDGFLDVTDAVSSWKPLEQRREILKDSNVGAFAVIWCVFLALAGFSFFASAPEGASGLSLLFVPVVSRCCSAIAVMNLKPMSTSQYARSLYPAWHTAFLILVILICTGSSFVLCGKYGFMVIAVLCGYGLALRRSFRLLDGMNGDVSGFCLTISELCAVAVYTLV